MVSPVGQGVRRTSMAATIPAPTNNIPTATDGTGTPPLLGSALASARGLAETLDVTVAEGVALAVGVEAALGAALAVDVALCVGVAAAVGVATTLSPLGGG